MFRLLLWAIIIYFGYRLVKRLFSPPTRPSNDPYVRGERKNKPLDINDADIEDASYREIDDD
jgi:hypothetical protein